MKIKDIGSMAHNWTHSFMSAMNHVDGDYVFEDMFALAEDVVLHRIRLGYEALAEGRKPALVLEELLQKLG